MGLLFGASIKIVLVPPGLYEVLVLIEGETVRRLAFDVVPDVVIAADGDDPG